VRSGGSWWVRQRYLTGGLDDQVAGRFAYSGAPRNLALVRTRDGTTLTAVRGDGTQETESWYYSRDPFGKIDQLVGTAGTISSETGFTGASTPNQTGGFVYLRNRWYDPQTGRFLTQDPIGLAGGVNLYSYAGNNPISFGDPFGLCPPESPWTPECDKGLETPLIDPVALLAGGILGGLKSLGAMGLRSIGARATVGAAAESGASAAVENAGTTSIRFAQRTVSSTFRHGEFAGQSVKSVAQGLRTGAINPSQLPLNVAVREGITYTMNNRSLMALRLADKVPTVLRNVTGNPAFERLLSERLAEMGGRVFFDFVPSIRP